MEIKVTLHQNDQMAMQRLKKLEMASSDCQEERFLARIARVFVRGGTVAITVEGEDDGVETQVMPR